MLLFKPHRGLVPPNRERPHSCRPESSVTARLVAGAFRAGPSPQPLAAARVPSALTAAAVACSAHEPCLPGDPQVRLPHGCALTVPPFSRRYAIPPEHGKRLERLAIGRCLRRWGGPGGEARAREAGRLGGAAGRGVTILFPRPLACSHAIRSVVPLPGPSLHGLCTACCCCHLRHARRCLSRVLGRASARFPKSSGRCAVWGRPRLGLRAPG